LHSEALSRMMLDGLITRVSSDLNRGLTDEEAG